MTHSTPLTFGSTFTLPHTGDRKWTIRDKRPREIQYRPDDTVAVATLEQSVMQLDFAPDLGGWVRGGRVFFEGADREQVLEQVRALPVDMAHRTPAEWLALYQARIEEAVTDSLDEGPAVWNLDRLASWKTAIDHREVRAHAAAAAAVKLAGPGAAGGLFAAVYSATMSALASVES